MPCILAWGPNNADESTAKMTERQNATLAVVVPVIVGVDCVGIEHLECIFKCKTSLAETTVALGLVEGDLHRKLCNHIK
jgi:hypothetical protein